MKRSYIVIPEGTPIVVIEASSPTFAASKARKGKGERVTTDASLVSAGSTVTVAVDTPLVIAGQLAWSDDGSTIERT
jgi:hypothetical protein